MLDTNDYLKLAASNFKVSEKHLMEAEDSLHLLMEKLDNCLKLLKGLSRSDVLMWEQVDAIVRDTNPADVGGLHPVVK